MTAMKTIGDTLIESIESVKKPKMVDGVIQSFGPFQMAEFVMNMSAILINVAATREGLEDNMVTTRLLSIFTNWLSLNHMAIRTQEGGFLEWLFKQEDTGWDEDCEHHWNTLGDLGEMWNKYAEEELKRRLEW